MQILIKTTYPATLEKPEGQYKEETKEFPFDLESMLDFRGVLYDAFQSGAKVEMVEIKD